MGEQPASGDRVRSIHLQPVKCGAAARGHPNSDSDITFRPHEMVIPLSCSRIEQPYFLSDNRIGCLREYPFVGVAWRTSEREVLGSRRSALVTGNDMIDRKGRRLGRGWRDDNIRIDSPRDRPPRFGGRQRCPSLRARCLRICSIQSLKCGFCFQLLKRSILSEIHQRH